MSTEQQTQLLTEIRDLLQVLAEPEIAKRDKARRLALRKLVGKSGSKAKAALLMDGSKSQAAICKESGIDSGNLSRLVKALRTEKLIGPDEKFLKLVIIVPKDFFEEAIHEND
jgi:hypothetical protein